MQDTTNVACRSTPAILKDFGGGSAEYRQRCFLQDGVALPPQDQQLGLIPMSVAPVLTEAASQTAGQQINQMLDEIPNQPLMTSVSLRGTPRGRGGTRRGRGGRGRTGAVGERRQKMSGIYEGYRRIERPREPTPDNEIRVMGDGRVAKYVVYASRLLKEQTANNGTAGVTIRATGRAVPVAISVCELIKRRMHNELRLHQVTTIGWTTIVDDYEPLQPGLIPRQQRRSVPSVSIFLSPDSEAVDKTAPGYQSPLEALEDEDRILTPPMKRPFARTLRRALQDPDVALKRGPLGTIMGSHPVVTTGEQPESIRSPTTVAVSNKSATATRFSSAQRRAGLAQRSTTQRIKSRFPAPLNGNPNGYSISTELQAIIGSQLLAVDGSLSPPVFNPYGSTSDRGRGGRRGRRSAQKRPVLSSQSRRADTVAVRSSNEGISRVNMTTKNTSMAISASYA